MINVTKTFLPNIEKYKLYIDRIYESGWLTNNGQFVLELEKRLEEYLNVKNILLLANGTLALQVALRALLSCKGEVITTPFSFVATTSSLVWEGFTPVFADINPSTLNLNPNNIPALINKRTLAILPVHVFGNACHIESIQEIASSSGIKVIYDAAHAFGVKYKEKSILEYGDASVLSFHSTKIFHTIEGGAIIFKNREDYDHAKLMINFGIPGYDQISTLGINCKMNEFQAAMGLCVLDEINIILEGRKRVWKNYHDAFVNFDKIILQQQNSYSEQNFSYFPIILANEVKTMGLKSILNSKDIWPRRYFYPSLERAPFILDSEDMKNSSDISSRILCLPLYSDLDIGSQRLIIETIYNYLY